MEDVSQKKKLYMYVDESGTSDDSDVLYMAMVVTEDPETIKNLYSSLVKDILSDPEMSGNIESIRNEGLKSFHYTTDHIEVKSRFIELMSSLNFDAYVTFVRKSEIVGDNSKIYLLKKMLTSLLAQRVLNNHYKEIHIVYERFDEGSQAVEDSFSDELVKLGQELLHEYNTKIEDMTITFEDKSELCLSLSDYVCGIISVYINKKLKNEPVKDSFEERSYNRISGKIRMINDLTRKKFYSRRDPFDIESI